MKEYELPNSLKEKLKLDEPIKMRNKIKKELEELLGVNISDETFSNILTMCMLEDARRPVSEGLDEAAENYCKSTLLGSQLVEEKHLQEDVRKYVAKTCGDALIEAIERFLLDYDGLLIGKDGSPIGVRNGKRYITKIKYQIYGEEEK